MRTVIYKITTLEVVKITEEDVCITQLKNDEDFMPESMWLQGMKDESDLNYLESKTLEQ